MALTLHLLCPIGQTVVMVVREVKSHKIITSTFYHFSHPPILPCLHPLDILVVWHGIDGLYGRGHFQPPTPFYPLDILCIAVRGNSPAVMAVILLYSAAEGICSPDPLGPGQVGGWLKQRANRFAWVSQKEKKNESSLFTFLFFFWRIFFRKVCRRFSPVIKRKVLVVFDLIHRSSHH